MKLLWADDQVEQAQTFAAALGAMSIDVRFACNGEDALDAVSAGDVEVVLVDLRMPPGEWGGLWFLERLAAMPSAPPAIVVSGEGSQQETIQAMRLGAADYIEKHRLSKELPARLDAVITRAMLDLVDGEESDRLEFKQTLRAAADTGAVNLSLEAAVAKAIAALANKAGGTLVVGRSDDGLLTGLDADLKTLKNIDGFERRLREVITDLLGVATNGLVSVRFPTLRGTQVAVVRVTAARQPVFVEFKKKKEAFFYVRTGNASVPLNVAESYRYIRERFCSAAGGRTPS